MEHKKKGFPADAFGARRAPALMLLLALIVTGGVLAQKRNGIGAQYSAVVGPTQSSPIALSSDEEFLVNVNPDVDTITIFRALPHKTKVDEIKVGDEPNSVAIHPDGRTAYVANTLDGTVSVVDLTPRK